MVAACLLVAAPAAAAAVPASGSKPAGLGPDVRVLNLHAAYAARLGHTRPGRISGITYARGKQPGAAKTKTSCAEPNCPLVYHGGAVQHHPHLYLLFWGPAWASDSGEQATASYLESFYAGLGAQPNDSWSTTTDQYGDSSGHPSFSGSVYDGAFQDTSTPPSGVDQSQLAAEADAFANSNAITDLADAQIIIATQSGTCPAGFYAPSCAGGTGSYCAWHSASNEPYTNLPYILDAGSGCGENYVNFGSSGTDDGFSIVGGHEYAETITDPLPPSGWVDSGDFSGGEIGDKCAWRNPSGDVTLSTGTFAMQSMWSNSAYRAGAAGCVMSTIATSTALSSSVNPVVVGQQVTYTATVSPVPDGGSVAFTDGGGVISGCGSVAVDTSTGTAVCAVSYATAAGSPRSIKATYSGDTNYKNSQSSALSQSVQPAASPTNTGGGGGTPPPSNGGGGAGGSSATESGAPRSVGTGVRDAVTCSGPAGDSCQVTETLVSTEALRGGKPFAVSASVAKKKRKVVVVGAKSVTIAGGESATITIELNATGRRLLKRFGKLPVIVSVTLERGGQQVTVARQKVTIKPPKHPGRAIDAIVPVALIAIRF